jgi:hypothetical protein
MGTIFATKSSHCSPHDEDLSTRRQTSSETAPFASSVRAPVPDGRLGQGGWVMWRADDLVLGVPVALADALPTAEGRLLLLNEVRLARRITHPAICRVFDIGGQGDKVFMSMELVPGRIWPRRSIASATCRPSGWIGGQLCDALAAALPAGHPAATSSPRTS